MAAHNDARNRAASIMAADRLAAVSRVLDAPPKPGAVVFWDFMYFDAASGGQGAWSIRCDACSIPAKAYPATPLVTNLQAKDFLQGIQEKHNREHHPKKGG